MSITASLQAAIDNLQIQDVYLRDFTARAFENFDPKYCPDYEKITVQTKHSARQSEIVELEDNRLLLRVFVELGARWVDTTEEDEERSVRALIEAEFIAEYAMKAALEQASVDEFALKNVSYHVWPYWRELLTNQCARMHLPRVVLPTMQLAHNRHSHTSTR